MVPKWEVDPQCVLVMDIRKVRHPRVRVNSRATELTPASQEFRCDMNTSLKTIAVRRSCQAGYHTSA